MTILTKQPGDKKDIEEKALKKEFVDVAIENPGGRTASASTRSARRSQSWGGDGELPVEWYLAWRRRRLLTSLCAVLLILWLLLAGAVGGLLLFRHLHNLHRPVFYGFCGTGYTERDAYGHPRYEKLQERLEIDQDNEYEKIEVPQFGPNRPAIFIHDFRQNLTAIVDILGYQCFIKKLDRRRIAPPSSFIDLVKKMESGYYEQNSEVIRESYRVRLPALTGEEMAELDSYMIGIQCAHHQNYMLDKYRWFDELSSRKKRETGEFKKFIVYQPTENHETKEVVEYQIHL